MTPEPPYEESGGPRSGGPGAVQSPVDGGGRQAQEVLRAAAQRLRRQADARWVEVSDRVVAAAMTATRRSLPLRAMAPGGPVHVSEQVVVAHLRAAIDEAVADAATAAVTLEVRDRDALTGVVIQLVARYGRPLLPIADHVRDVTAARLVDLLGPTATTVTVHEMHVHFSDVTTGDPHTSSA